MARVTRNKVQHSKNFSLTEYGSWSKAEQAAKEWLETIKRDLPPPATSRDRLTARNNSGYVGVALKSSTRQLAEGDVSFDYAWHAFWPDNPIGTRWAVNKYGDDSAFVHAVLSRQLESTDREEVEAQFKKISGKRAFRQILEQKALELV